MPAYLNPLQHAGTGFSPLGSTLAHDKTIGMGSNPLLCLPGNNIDSHLLEKEIKEDTQ